MIPLIDSDRYPLDQADHPATEALVARCRAELAERAVCVVERLLTPTALPAMAAEAERLAPLAHHRAARRNCYIGVEDDPSLPASHPRRRFMATTLGVVADDLIPADALVRELYDWPAFQGFLAAIMGYPALSIPTRTASRRSTSSSTSPASSRTGISTPTTISP